MRAIYFALFAAGCSVGAETDQSLEFRGEIPVLPDFKFDTGLQPASGPVQVQFLISAGGSLVATADAIAGGDGDALAVAGVPGSGTYTLDAHFKAAAMLHVDTAGMKYDGPIPGIENIDIAFGGQAMFDPFLMTNNASVTAMLPETKLPNIPLPGGLPGHLELTIAAGSTMTSELRGSCASFEGTSAKFTATTSTSANLIIKPKIVLKVPVVGDKDFGLPDVKVPVPAIAAALDLGVQEFAGGGDAPTGELAKKGSCEGDGPSGPGGGNEPEPLVCEVVAGPYDRAYHIPQTMYAGQCGSTQLAAWKAACASSTATAAACSSFKQQNLACFDCITSDSTDVNYGPVVYYNTFGQYNIAGCLVDVAPGELQCAQNIQKYFQCIDTACSSCSDSTTDEQDACFANAQQTTCAVETTDAANCFNRLQNDTRTRPCLDYTYDYAGKFCGNR
jgi:hypothetical protein